MSITLLQEFVASNEACISWSISAYAISQNSKPVLCLSDINQSGVNVFSTVKYLIRPNEIYQGTHTFTGLQPGSYNAEIVIITGNTSQASDPLPVTVYQVDIPVFETDGIVSGNRKFTITLEQPNSDMTNGTVTFVLYGQPILLGDTQNSFVGIVNQVFPYVSSNTYVVDNNIINNVEYEIVCFYTNSVNISGLLSQAELKRPTDAPNQITQIASIYNASYRTLTITHNLPSNAMDYDLVDCRATITDAENNVTYYYSSENSANLDPAPNVADPVVFNMTNKSLLPVDVPFTVTLSVKNEVNLWGPVESPAIYCINTNDFSATPLSVSDLIFSVGLTSISISDNNTYVKNNTYNINYTATVYECLPNGNTFGSAIETKTQTNNMNFEFTNLTTGQLYKVLINLNYTYTFSNNTTATIEQNIMDTCYKHFIPYDIPNDLTLSATPSDQDVTVNWLDITQQELNGFLLDHYEVSDDEITWINKNTLLSHNFSGLTNGTSYTFYVRAVSNSGTSLYISGETINGQTASITSIPYGRPSNLTKVSQLPENEKCTVVWTITANPYNGGLFNAFQASVNSGSYASIVPSFANDQYTYEFTGLNNLLTNNIAIRLVNNNQANANNVNTTKISDSLHIYTVPFHLPAVPANLAASPDTTSVTLSWTAVTPSSIIDNSVQYELYYKLQSDSVFTIVSNIATNSYIVTGLTSNSIYDFKIRSSIYNSEVSTTFYSDFSAILSSRPFIYLNTPNMILEAGANTIVAKLSPNVNNFFQTIFKYYATVSNIDGSNSNTIVLSNVTNSNVQTITFTVLGDNTQLIDLTQYKVEAYYQMLNTDNSQYYSSSEVDNVIRPFNPVLSPVLSSVSGNTVVDLTWDISVFAGYTINYYELSNDNVSWAPFTTSISQFRTNISTTIAGLTNGTSYDFYVRVVYEVNNETKTSTPSNMVTNIPYTISSAPTNVTTISASQQITLYWEQPTNLNGLDLDHYEVKLENGNWSDVGTNISHTFTGLTNGQSYTMYVRAVTLNVLEGNVYVYGESASNYGIPSGVAIAPTFQASGTFMYPTWDNPYRFVMAVNKLPGTLINNVWTETIGSNTGGLPVTRYEYSIDNVNWTTMYNSPDSSVIVINTSENPGSAGFYLPPSAIGNTYDVRVRAVCTHPTLGEMPGTSYIRQILVYLNPTKPIINTNVAGDKSLTINWNSMLPYVSGSVTADGLMNGLPFTKFQVAVNNYGNGTNWIDVGSNTSYTFTDLTNGTIYAPIVRAIGYDQYENSPEYTQMTTIYGDIATFSENAPYFAATAPTLNARVQGDTQIALTWNVPDLGGLSLVRYEMSLDGTSWTSSVGNSNYTDSLTTPSFVFTSLTNGQSYNLRVRAITSHPALGEITGVTFTSSAYVPYKVSTTPQVTITPSNQQNLLQWPASDLGGLSLSDYQISYNNGSTWSNLSTDLGYSVTDSVYSLTKSGLLNGTSYSYSIRCVTTHPNLGAINSNSVTVTAIPFVKPGVVTNVVASATNNILDFSFTSPANVNNNVLLQYNEYSIDEGVNWYDIYQLTYFTTNIGNTSFSLKIRVYIINPNDNSTHVNGDIYTLNNLQNVDIVTPQNLASSFGNGTVTLNWDAVNVQGMAYQVRQYFSNGSTNTNVTNNNTYTFTGLTNGIAYTFGVALYLNNAAGPFSNITVTPMVAPVIDSVTKSGDILSVNVNFGGSANVHVVLTASNVVTINDKEYIPVDGGQQTISVDASSSPITFSGMTNKTLFDIVVSNTVGNVSGKYSV
jgi:hypothetical protein